MFCVITHLFMWFGVPSALPRTVISKVDLTSLRIEMSCGNSSTLITIDQDVSLDGTDCSSNQSIHNELRFHSCTTSCENTINPLKICLYDEHNSPQDCSDYGDFEGRYLTGGSLHFNGNGSVKFWSNFTAEEGLVVSGMGCRMPTLNYATQCAVICRGDTSQTVMCRRTVAPENRAKTIAL